MSEMDEKLGAILNNPQMMQQIMQLAQSLNQPSAGDSAAEAPRQPPKSAPQHPDASTGIPMGMDMSMLQKFSSIAREGTIDKNQRALLKALNPYLSRDRIERLERAMHAAKLAQLASGFLNNGGLQILSGR